MSEPGVDLSDELLANRAVSDSAAFGVLYDRFVARVYRYCLRRLGDRQDAEDATSAVFMRVLERIATFRGESFAAWLFAIARNVVADRFRRLPMAPSELPADAIDPAPLPDEIALNALSDRAVRTMLDVLPADQREVVELRLAGLTGAEIAAAMDRSVAAVKMLQLRAMKRLRADYAGADQEETSSR